MREDQMKNAYILRNVEVEATGYPASAGFLVKAGARARVEGNRFQKRNQATRQDLINRGVLSLAADKSAYVLAQDHLFNSASQAADVLLDGPCSGPQSWKNPRTGRTLKDEAGGTR